MAHVCRCSLSLKHRCACYVLPRGQCHAPRPACAAPAFARGGLQNLGDEIGKGGFGTVFRALNTETGDFVAIKRLGLRSLDKSDLESLQSEINLLKKLNHPNIVKYVDTIRTVDYLHIVLEYVENGSLAQTIKKFGSFSESLTAIYISQVLQGLDYLHEQGVIHRDIKGANILTTKAGLVKLADFGVAISDTEKSNSVVGTPYWSESSHSRRADVITLHGWHTA